MNRLVARRLRDGDLERGTECQLCDGPLIVGKWAVKERVPGTMPGPQDLVILSRPDTDGDRP
jgi:hypothetical protein